MEVINKRRSVRDYLDKEVEKEKIDMILRSAMQAPSACNQQGTRYLVVKDKEKLRLVSSKFQTMRFTDKASFIIVFLIEKEGLIVPNMAPVDAAACVENAMLEATNQNVGSCWCGVWGRENREEEVRLAFNLPEHLDPFAIVTFGYPKDSGALKFIDRYDSNKVFFEEITK